MNWRPWIMPCATVVLGACSSTVKVTPAEAPPPAACTTNEECPADATRPFCDIQTGTCVEQAPANKGEEIGKGDGSSTSVNFVTIGKFPAAMVPVDLAFHSLRAEELWVVGYGDDSVQVARAATIDTPKWVRYLDPAAMHFMHKP